MSLFSLHPKKNLTQWMLQSLTFYLHPSPSSRPLCHLSSVRVGMKATDGTSGVRGYTLWDKGEEKSLK